MTKRVNRRISLRGLGQACVMNALGLKARRDGFPARFGNAEVTPFGRYDRTEDFVGGDVNPPFSSDPAEFTALRAGS